MGEPDTWKMVRTTENRELNMHMKAGSVVRTADGTWSTRVFSSGDLNTLFGTSGITWGMGNSVCFFANGDWNANPHAICSAYADGYWWAQSTDSTNLKASAIRINYLAIGWG